MDTTLPNLMIVGSPKCGTTTLAHLLGQHADIFMTTPKEPGFFSDQVMSREEYVGLFRGSEASRYRGEATPGYAQMPQFGDVIGRVQSEISHPMKFIFAIRQPVKRIESHFAFRLHNGRTTGNIDEVVQRRPEYLRTSCYGMQAQAWVDAFGRECVHIVRLEDMKASMETELRKIYAFLDLEPSFPADMLKPQNARPAGAVPRPPRLPSVLSPLRRLVPRRAHRLVKRLLTRTTPEEDLRLSPTVVAELEAEFRVDFQILRELVGPDMDLYGYA